MYKIMGCYNSVEPEELDSTDYSDNAEYLLGEYKMAFGDNGWEIYIEAGK